MTTLCCCEQGILFQCVYTLHVACVCMCAFKSTFFSTITVILSHSAMQFSVRGFTCNTVFHVCMQYIQYHMYRLDTFPSVRSVMFTRNANRLRAIALTLSMMGTDRTRWDTIILVFISGELIVSRYIAESITTDAGCFLVFISYHILHKVQRNEVHKKYNDILAEYGGQCKVTDI